MSNMQTELTGLKRDSIRLSDFLPKTQQGFMAFCIATDCPELLASGLPEYWALLYYFKLRKAKDCAEWFPSGKWATLQRLEQLIEEAA